ncbi:hypothetical protein NDU88_010475 [Pleurodeles waltl]|uniref:Uncharacterized protein n=1 Tax=Pleurodeles waltl TaxID=8319 RepID=A0AAV7Q233_PLEWA|nr:hypothetical protein NDU88_010475 [Pleurodeles waltl]
METKRRSPLPTQAHQCGSSILRRRGDPRRGGKKQREGAQEEAQTRPLRVRSPLGQPLLGTALSPAGPGVIRLRQAHPRSSGKGPWSTSAGPGPSRRPGTPALLRDPDRRVRIVAVGLLLGQCIYLF